MYMLGNIIVESVWFNLCWIRSFMSACEYNMRRTNRYALGKWQLCFLQDDFLSTSFGLVLEKASVKTVAYCLRFSTFFLSQMTWLVGVHPPNLQCLRRWPLWFGCPLKRVSSRDLEANAFPQEDNSSSLYLSDKLLRTLALSEKHTNWTYQGV